MSGSGNYKVDSFFFSYDGKLLDDQILPCYTIVASNDGELTLSENYLDRNGEMEESVILVTSDGTNMTWVKRQIEKEALWLAYACAVALAMVGCRIDTIRDEVDVGQAL